MVCDDSCSGQAAESAAFFCQRVKIHVLKKNISLSYSQCNTFGVTQNNPQTEVTGTESLQIHCHVDITMNLYSAVFLGNQ